MPRPTLRQLNAHLTAEAAMAGKDGPQGDLDVEILSVSVNEDSRELDVVVRLAEDPADSHRHWKLTF